MMLIEFTLAAILIFTNIRVSTPCKSPPVHPEPDPLRL